MALRVRNLGVLDRVALELGRETPRFLEGSGLHGSLARIAPDRLAALPEVNAVGWQTKT